MVDPGYCLFVPYVCYFVLSKTVGKQKSVHHFLKVTKIELCLLLRYKCKSVVWPKLCFFLSWSVVSIGFSMGSITLEYVRSSFFQCIEKEVKLRITWRMLSMYCCVVRIGDDPKGLVMLSMTKNFSLNVLSNSWNSTFFVVRGASNCPLATKNGNSGGGPFFNNVCWASNRILRESASGMTLGKVLLSMRPSMFNSLKTIGKYSIRRLFFNGKIVDSETNLVSPSGVTWSSGKVWSSLTATCLWWFFGLGGKLGSGDVSITCGFTVHKSINASRSASDTCESVIRSLPSIRLLD